MGIFSKRKREKPVELSEFISGTLTQLIDGIAKAQEHARKNNAMIIPSTMFYSDFDKLSRTKDEDLVHIVEFDIALAVEENKQLKGGIGIVVPEISMGYQGTIKKHKNINNRVQFSIPIILPSQGKK